jgi:hypothetical protein
MNYQKGFIALITILSASAIALLISSTILLKSVTEATYSIDEESSAKAWATVNACGEYALYNLASTTNSGGSEWYTFNSAGDGMSLDIGDTEHSCYIYTIVGTTVSTSSPRIIHASSTVNNFTRKLSITAATNTPSVIVSSWSEVADF